jgi:WD40 repeat protein
MKTYPFGPHWKTWFSLEPMKNMEAKTMKTLHSLVAGLWPASLILARRIAFPLLFLGAGLMLVQPCLSAPFQFEETGSLATARYFHTATLLPNGKVLVAGGGGNSGYLASAELYDPATGTWTATGSLHTARWIHTATLLPNGKVLVAGGFDTLSSAELYDSASGTWTATGSLANPRFSHTATLLPNGKVLVAGGELPYNVVLSSAELYDVGLGFSSDWQSKIDHWKLTDGRRLLLTGCRFQGISQASGGNTQDSSSNYPIVQLRSIDNSEVAFLPVDPIEGWSDTSFTSLPVKHFPFGPALVTVFTNGIPSTARYVVVEKCDR